MVATRRKAPRSAQLRLSVVGSAEGLPSRATLRRWVQLALERDAHITLVFIDARGGRRLNREFRGRDYATNVLTFGYQKRPRILADIVLCVPVLAREARAQGKTLRQHLAHLLIHGTLHAHGYDHQTDRQAKKMQNLERQFLSQIGIQDPYAALEN